MKSIIELKSGKQNYKIVGEIARVPQQRRGYAVVNFKNCIYQLFGGIRNNEFINIDHPIRCRRKLRQGVRGTG